MTALSRTNKVVDIRSTWSKVIRSLDGFEMDESGEVLGCT
jgi:hypothetical protein